MYNQRGECGALTYVLLYSKATMDIEMVGIEMVLFPTGDKQLRSYYQGTSEVEKRIQNKETITDPKKGDSQESDLDQEQMAEAKRRPCSSNQ